MSELFTDSFNGNTSKWLYLSVMHSTSQTNDHKSLSGVQNFWRQGYKNIKHIFCANSLRKNNNKTTYVQFLLENVIRSSSILPLHTELRCVTAVAPFIFRRGIICETPHKSWAMWWDMAALVSLPKERKELGKGFMHSDFLANYLWNETVWELYGKSFSQPSGMASCPYVTASNWVTTAGKNTLSCPLYSTVTWQIVT